MSAAPEVREGVVVSFAEGRLRVQARRSAVPPAQIEALRRHKADLAFLLDAFPGSTVELRPATPIPPPIIMGSWPVWSEPLGPRRGKARKRATSGGWQGPGPDPGACVHCGEFCAPADLTNGQRPDGEWEHLACHLRVFAGWTPSEMARRRIVEAGGTAVANRREASGDARLVEWARQTGRYVSIGRDGPWGNADRVSGNCSPERRRHAVGYFRDTQLPSRPDLIARLPELRAKVLVCWCHPKECHGDVLVEAVGALEVTTP